MIIKNLTISSFGNKKDFKMSFTDGVNIIEGNNEAGKSTVCEFIRYVLYGFDRDERERYTPFMSDICSGSLEIADGDDVYYVARSESQTKKNITIRKNGVEVKGINNPGSYIFGIPGASLFRSTVFVGQGRTKTEGDAPAAIHNLLFSGDENISAKKAVDSLDKLRAELKHDRGKGGLIDDLSEQINELDTKLKTNREELEIIDGLNDEIASLNSKIEYEERRLDEVVKTEITYKIKKLRDERAEIDREGEASRRALDALSDFEILHKRGDRMPDKNDRNKLFDAVSELRTASQNREDEKTNLLRILKETHSTEEDISKTEKENEKKIAKLKRDKLFCSALVAILIAAMIISVGIGTIMIAKNKLTVGAAVVALAVVFLIGVFSAMKIRQHIGTKIINLIEMPDEKIKLLILASKKEDAEKSLKDADERLRVASKNLEIFKNAWGLSSSNPLEELNTIMRTYDDLSREKSDTNFKYIEHKTELETKIADEILPDDDGREINLPPNYNDSTYEKNREMVLGMISSHNQMLTKKRIEIAERKARVSDRTAIAEEKNVLEPQREEAKKKLASVKLAISKLKEAEDDMKRNVSPQIAKDAEKYYSVITDGKYSYLGVDTDFELSFTPDDGAGGNIDRGSKYMSVGTKDASYLSLRLALNDLVGNGKCLPVILDESLMTLDNDRLLKALGVLEASGRQVLLFSSSDRERRVAEMGDISFTSVAI